MTVDWLKENYLSPFRGIQPHNLLVGGLGFVAFAERSVHFFVLQQSIQEETFVAIHLQDLSLRRAHGFLKALIFLKMARVDFTKESLAERN